MIGYINRDFNEIARDASGRNRTREKGEQARYCLAITSRLITCRCLVRSHDFSLFDHLREVFIGYPRSASSNNGIIDNRYRRNGARKTKVHVDEEINYKKTDILRINSTRILSVLQEQNYTESEAAELIARTMQLTPGVLK